jgi:hypothetical protein
MSRARIHSFQSAERKTELSKEDAFRHLLTNSETESNRVRGFNFPLLTKIWEKVTFKPWPMNNIWSTSTTNYDEDRWIFQWRQGQEHQLISSNTIKCIVTNWARSRKRRAADFIELSSSSTCSHRTVCDRRARLLSQLLGHLFTFETTFQPAEVILSEPIRSLGILPSWRWSRPISMRYLAKIINNEGGRPRLGGEMLRHHDIVW